MRILVACEESQTVTKELRSLGHEAFSCDMEPCSGGHPEWHIQGDAILSAYNTEQNWDMMIAHPPCTYLTVTGNKWMSHQDDKNLPFEDRRPHPRFPDRKLKRAEAIEFFKKLYNAPIPMVAIENPVGVMSTVFMKPTQYVHPFHFGDPHSKRTGWWLRDLPKLEHTDIVEPEMYTYKDGRKDPIWHVESMKLPPKERARVRSQTFPGMAKQIAEQWAGKIN